MLPNVAYNFIVIGNNFEIINLDHNKLVRFDANVFQPTLQTMLSNIGSYISIGIGNTPHCDYTSHIDIIFYRNS